MSAAHTAPRFTILIPVYNERENLVAVIEEVLDVTSASGTAIIVIDDGSDDGTGSLLQEFATRHDRLRAILHPQRSGKSAALRTGALATQSLWLGTMDGDGQDDPRDLLTMAEEIHLDRVDDVGLVGGVRQARTDGNSRKYASRFANGLRRRLLQDDCPDTACGLKVIPRDVFLALPFFDALHRYLPALTQKCGFRAVYVPVTNRPRVHGTSKYSNIGRAAAGAVDLLGVSWLLRRTSIPSKTLLLRSGHDRDRLGMGDTKTAAQ